jgi:alpha-tubulin suppressor-like RCC1 family protein
MAVTGPNTGFTLTESGVTSDLGNRYVSKDYLLDVYPNLVSPTGNRTSPGLYVWGFQTSPSGEYFLGLGDSNHRSSPVQLGSLSNWNMASYGDTHVIALKTDGTLWGWGGDSGSRGAFGVVTNLGGTYSTPIQLGADTNWKFVKAGRLLSVGLKNDGSMWATGYNLDGQLGFGTGGVNVSSWTQIGSDTNWKQLVYGEYSGYALKNNGTLWSWGFNGSGQLGHGNIVHRSSPTQVGSLTNWKQVSAGLRYGMAVKTDGTLWAWGHNNVGQLGLGDLVHRSSPVQVGSLTNWKEVSCGGWACFAIKTDGTLWAWGHNPAGDLGLNDTNSRSSPVQVGSLTNWKRVFGACGKAIKTDGTLWGWGRNSEGNVGVGTATDRSSPIQIGTETTWKSCNYDGYNTTRMTTFAIKDGYF